MTGRPVPPQHGSRSEVPCVALSRKLCERRAIADERQPHFDSTGVRDTEVSRRWRPRRVAIVDRAGFRPRAEAGWRATADGSLIVRRREGTWRSDAVRAVAEWRQHRPITDEQTAELGRLFGHLRITYAGRRVNYDFTQCPLPGMDRASIPGRFAVVAQDAVSVVILAP